jgi:hypothetical protein
MITDGKAGRMFLMLHRGHTVAAIARRLNMGERTIRNYRDAGVLPRLGFVKMRFLVPLLKKLHGLL